MTPEVPDRIRWAIDLLDLQPHHRVLEIGCGPGVAAGVIADRLANGHLLAIDRSATALDRAIHRNRRHVDVGRIEFRCTGLAELGVGSGPFDAAVAMNVNLFWTGPAEPEWRVLDAMLARPGILLLTYGFGSNGPSGRTLDAESRVTAALHRHGYAATTATTDGSWAIAGRR